MLRLQEYLAEHEANSFQGNYRTLDAVIKKFEAIGQTIKNLAEEVITSYPDTPWEEMCRLRNRISLAYFGVDIKSFGALLSVTFLII
ncbi:DUF86 domain-containing protein [Adhaeribacter arboris]|uniref:DUF86 domain-containing protein n=1 Tax=Adhaeribacter arboris TaxID=2072846 RepID=A0A2T2YAA7_9BACT|nr:HepT-like ribonuclease domain-containing protein [Adhaeribacter arboris]PSR52434.1 DUF86 domain-containing protein [Adhaeribacter arboris]